MIIYLVYGMAFLLLGTVALLRARTPFSVFPSRPMWLLATFALLHGAHEWFELVKTTTGAPTAAFELADTVDLILLTASFGMLAAFGVDLLTGGRKARRAIAIPAALLVLWTGTILLSVLFEPAGSWQHTAPATSRYLLGFPGALLAALGLHRVARQNAAISKRIEWELTAAAGLFLLYGIFGGIIVRPVSFMPGVWLNTESFFGLTGIPVIVLRAICALGIAFFLSEAFTVEIGKVHAQMEILRKEFIAIVAHDLRSPITTISLSTELLQKALVNRSLTPAQEDLHLNHIRAAVAKLTRLVTDMVDSSMIEINRITLKKERMEWLSFISEIVEREAATMSGHALKLQIDPAHAEAAGVWVEADPGRMDQVMTNLLSNAAKYSSAGSEISVRVDIAPHELAVNVTNQGPGMAPEELPLLFTRFHRSQAARMGLVSGLGLGLFIVKDLVEAHGGRVSAESDPGHETTFRFTLPRVS